MNRIINRSTFQATTHEVSEYGSIIERGTVEVTFQGQTRRVDAHRYAYGDGSRDDITVHCFTGRYRTGTTDWPASVTNSLGKNGEYESANFGRDDRSGRFQKMRGLSWRTQS